MNCKSVTRASPWIVACLGLFGCASVVEWASTPPSNRLANGRCRNPNDATTTIECEQLPPPIARASQQPQRPSPPADPARDAKSNEAARSEVLAKLAAGLEGEAASLFWALPQGARTNAFAATITKTRVERARSLESKPRDVAEAMTSLKLDSLPGDKEVLAALAGRVAKGLLNLAKYGAADSKDFRLGALLVQAVRQHPTEMADRTGDGLSAFEEKYGPLLVAAQIKDEEDWQAFIQLYPESKYSRELENNIAQLAQLAAMTAAAKRREDAANQLWDEARRHGDSLATLSYQIAFAEKHFTSPQSRRAVRNMRAHYPSLVANDYCPARKEFVDSIGVDEFRKRASEHCKDEPPEAGGLRGAQVSLVNECRAAFATACSP